MRRIALVSTLALAAAACAPVVDFDALTRRLDAGHASPESDASTAHVDAAVADREPPDAATAADAPAEGDAQSPADVQVGELGDGVADDAGAPCKGLAQGWYCGNDGLSAYAGKPTDLVHCYSDHILSFDSCSNGCVATPPTHPDTCDPCAAKPDGLYCAAAFAPSPAQPYLTNLLYQCAAGHVAAAPVCQVAAAACTEAIPGQACCSPSSSGADCGI